MLRRVLSGTLIVLSTLLFLLSLIGIGAAWYYNEPLTEESTAKLTEIDNELEQAQNALGDAQGELKRALRIVKSAEESLASLSEQKIQAGEFLDAVTTLLDDTVTPGLEESKKKLAKAQKDLDAIRKSIETLKNLPFVGGLIDIELPDDSALDFFVEMTDNLETEIGNVNDMAKEASTFLNDTSYLLAGDLTETKENIHSLMKVVDEYEGKIKLWRGKITVLIENLPRWLDHLSVFIAVFLLWFAFSQIGLLLHGLASWRGENTLTLKANKENKNENTK